MIDFELPFEETDWFLFGTEKENWTYITNNSVEGIEENRYLISDFGRVFDLKLNRRCTEYYFGGYKTVNLKTSFGNHTYLIHRITAIEFYGRHENPEKSIVNHKNGKKQCCLLDNLEWVTEDENRQHAYDTGLITNYNEDSILAKLTNEQALNIMYQLRDGIPIDDIVKTVPDFIQNKYSTVYSIRFGRAWSRLAQENDITFAEYENKRDRFSEEQKEQIGEMLSKGFHSKDIINSLGHDYNSMDPAVRRAFSSSISDIKSGRASKHIAEKYHLLDNKETSRQTSFSIFTIDQLHQACKIFENGFISYDDTLIKLGYNPTTMPKDERFKYVNALSALRRKVNYPEITSLYNF